MCDQAELIVSADARRHPRCQCLALLRKHMIQHDENGFPAPDARSGAAVIYTRRFDPEGNPPPRILASYCPFCGEAYE